MGKENKNIAIDVLVKNQSSYDMGYHTGSIKILFTNKSPDDYGLVDDWRGGLVEAQGKSKKSALLIKPGEIHLLTVGAEYVDNDCSSTDYQVVITSTFKIDDILREDKDAYAVDEIRSKRNQLVCP